MKKKLLTSITILLLLLTMTTAVFAYWAGAFGPITDVDANGKVTIGEGETIDTVIVVNDVTDNGPLVPVGYNGINNVDLKFEIDWDGEGATGAIGAIGALSVVTKSIMIDDTDVSHLFTVTLDTKTSITAGTPLEYTINVTFTKEPADLAEYNIVANGELVVTLTIGVTP